MSRLYASIISDASKTEATRRGHKDMMTHLRGWDFGVSVYAYVDEDDREVFEVFATGGSNGSRPARLVARLVDGDDSEPKGPQRAAFEAIGLIPDAAALAENDGIEQARAWAQLENVPCAHTIPGTCDYC